MTVAIEPDATTILGHLKDGLVLLALDGTILYTNAIFDEMVGRPGEDLRGRHGGSVLPAEAWARMDPSTLVSEGGAPVHFNIELCAAGPGDRHSYCFTSSPVRDAEGRVQGVLEDFRGMDQLRNMILEMEEVNRIVQREKDRADRIMGSIADGLFTVDAERVVRSFSPKLEALTGMAAASAVGRPCAEVLRGTKCETDCPLSWSFANGKAVERCLETFRPEGGRRVEVSVTTAFLHDDAGGVVGLTGLVHDRSEVERLRRELRQSQEHPRIIGRSARMREVFQVIQTVADTDATVLITGESGTGKEVVARAIHEGSARRDKPFVMLNCAALNDNLLESELFGHVRGAFTGAVADKPGRFEAAAGGTMFLDEIGDTTPALQAKLLRVLQEKAFERVGDTRTRRVDVRVLAATNRDLRHLVSAGRFREDLFYRLNVLPLDLPPLRDRREDVPLLVQHFIEKYRPRYFKGREDRFEGISNRALALMIAYDWPGNVRELEHAIEYAMISTTTGRIERAFLPVSLRRLQPPDAAPEAPIPAAPPPAEAPPERDDDEAALRRALGENQWSVARTAAALGISRTTLWRRMKRLEVGRRH